MTTQTDQFAANLAKAKAGVAEAQVIVGLAYQFGEGVAMDDAEAFEWFRQAAEQGNVSAQTNLGECYEEGWGTIQDREQAITRYRKAAEQGHAPAQFNLAELYIHPIPNETGINIKQNYKYSEAVKWYMEAANQGYAEAQLALGSLFEEGRGVEQDYTQAQFWYRKAADQDLEEAQEGLNRLWRKRWFYSQIPALKVFFALTVICIGQLLFLHYLTLVRMYNTCYSVNKNIPCDDFSVRLNIVWAVSGVGLVLAGISYLWVKSIFYKK